MRRELREGVGGEGLEARTELGEHWQVEEQKQAAGPLELAEGGHAQAHFRGRWRRSPRDFQRSERRGAGGEQRPEHGKVARKWNDEGCEVREWSKQTGAGGSRERVPNTVEADATQARKVLQVSRRR